MNKRDVFKKAELLAEIEHQWTTLNDALDRMTETQMTTYQDANGWTVKDHINHMMRWERSVLYFLQHLPRHEGLGIEEALYLDGSEDSINDEIYRRTKNQTLDESRNQFRENHDQLLEQLELLAENDLHKPYRDFLPEEPGEGAGPPAIKIIYDNTASHYSEHLEWIEAILGQSG